MILLGVDPHKSTHAAVAVAPEAHRQLASATVGARLPEYRRLLTWARQAGAHVGGGERQRAGPAPGPVAPGSR